MKFNQLRACKVIGLLALTSFCACTPSKPTGFGVDNSPIRYRTVKFSDPGQMAEVDGIKITSAQILDKSPVIKDLDEQMSEALIGLAYLKLAERSQATSTQAARGNVEVLLPGNDKPLAQILARFGRLPVSGLTLSYLKVSSDGAKSKGENQTIARLGADNVAREDLDTNNGIVQSIEQRRFNEVASQLNQQLSRILINEQAIKAKQPLQKYIDASVMGGSHAVINESELRSYLQKIGFAESELTPLLKEQFMASRAQQKEQRAIEEYVAKNILKAPVAVAFQPPQTVLHLSDKWRPVAGRDDAPVAVVAFSGTTCPDCPGFAKLMQGAMTKYDGYLKLNWIHNFNADDGVARMVSQAALCVDVAKPGKSLSFINAFAEKASLVDEHAFYEWTRTHSIPEKEFKSCFTEQKQNALLNQHIEYARHLGVVANPSVWVDGQMLEGVVRPEELERVINEKIAERQVSPISAFIRRLKSKFSRT